MTVEYARSNVDVRNDANITGSPAVLITGNNVTLRNAGYLDGNATTTIVQLAGSGITFINETSGNVGSDLFRSTVVGSDYADTIINDGHIRGRVELGGGDDVYIERSSSAEASFGDGNDRFDFIADEKYVDMYNLSLRLNGGAGTDTLNLSGFGLKLSPLVRDFEVLNVSSTLAYLNSMSGFTTVNLAPGGFYEFAYSTNPNVDLDLRASLSLRGTSSLRSITGSDGQEELRLAGNVRIGSDVQMGAGTDFVTVTYGLEAGAPQFGGVVDGGFGPDQLAFVNDRQTPLSIDLTQFRGFESIDIRSDANGNVLRGTSDASKLYLSANTLFSLDLNAIRLDVAAFSGDLRIGKGAVLGAVTGPGGHSNLPSPTNLSVTNDGRVLGDIRLGNGDDHYSASGIVGGTVFAFAGNDTMYGAAVSDRLNAGDGDDWIGTRGGNDVIDGGEGNDTLELAGTQSAYRLLQTGGRVVLVGAGEGIEVASIEQVRFGVGATRTMADVVASTASFDGLDYIASYADLRQAFGTDAVRGVEHFAAFGFGEGRSVTFSALAYVASHGDLRTALGADANAAARHYIDYGAREGRKVTFDALSYVASHSDLRAAFGADANAAARHYINYGANEGRGITFSASAYLAIHSDLRAVFGTDEIAAARHYIEWGAAEGRSPGSVQGSYIASDDHSLWTALSSEPLSTSADLFRYPQTDFDPLM